MCGSMLKLKSTAAAMSDDDGDDKNGASTRPHSCSAVDDGAPDRHSL